MVLWYYSLGFLSGGGLCFFSLAEMFRLWSLVLFSIFLVLPFRLCQAIVCGLVSSILLCCCVLLCQAVVFGLVLSLCFVRRYWSLVLLFVWLWSLFWSCFRLIFGYGYAVAEALRLWSLVLFLLSLLGGVVALLRTRLLFVYFFFISSFVCFFYLFLRCFSGLCLLSLSGGSGRITCFFRLVEVCYNFQVVLLVFVSFLVVFEIFMLWFFV